MAYDIIVLIILFFFPVNTALKVIKQMFEHDESLTQIPDGLQGLVLCSSCDPVSHIHDPVDIIDIVLVAKHKKFQFID